MSNKNLAQEFLEAVKIIASDSVKSANIDQTVLMQVTKVPTETDKTYEVKYQDQTYGNVLSTSSWDKDDFVYVMCPEGIDSTSQKIIISGLPKHKEIKETIQTFEDIYQIIGAQEINESKVFDSNNSIALSIIDKELLLAYLKRGNGLAISAKFLTAFPDAFFQHEDSEKCNFGIKVVLKVNNEEKVEEVSYVLDVNNMEGYPYLFTTATEQTEYFVIEHPENIIDVVSIECFLKDYPISSTTDTTLVTMSNISFIAFYDRRKVEKNELVIFTKDNLQSIEHVSNYSDTRTTLETIFFSKQKFEKIEYQWNKNDILISVDETSQSLVIPGGALLSEDNKFTCIVTIDDKDKYSNSYSIKNNFPLEVIIETTRQTNNIDYYTVSVTPADIDIYSYQWTKIGANDMQTSLSQTGASITDIDATKINGSDTYRCLVSYKHNNIEYPIAYVETIIVQLNYSYREKVYFTASATNILPESPVWELDPTKTNWSEDNKFLWKREDIYTIDFEEEKLSTQGVPYISSVWGKDGNPGISIVEVVNYYYASDSTDPPSKEATGWETTIPSNFNTTNKYLWSYEEIKYSNEDSDTTNPILFSYFGKPIKEIKEEYTTNNNPTSAPSSGWDDNMVAPTQDNKYLWNKETITYEDNTTSEQTTIIAVHGDRGDDGSTPEIRNGYWYINNKEIGQATGDPGDTPFINDDGNWQIGTNDTGYKAEGVDGTSFSRIEEKYYATNDATETPTRTSVSWDNTPSGAGYSVKRPILWNYENVYSKDSNGAESSNPTDPIIISYWGQAGDDGRIPTEFISYYAVGSSAISAPANEPVLSNNNNSISTNGTNWKTSITSAPDAGTYLWEKMFIKYDKKDQEEKNLYIATIAHIIGYNGENGDTVSTSTTDINYPLYLGSNSWITEWEGKLPSIDNGVLTQNGWLTIAPEPSKYPYYVYVLNYTQTTVESVVNETTSSTNSYSGPTKPAPDLYAYYNGAGASASPEQLASISAFMQLTKGGADQGIYYADEDGNQVTASAFDPSTGQLYINAEYIKTGKLQVQQTINGEKITHFEAGLGGEQPNVNIAGFIAKGTGPNEGYISKGKMAYNDDVEGVYLGTDGIGLGSGSLIIPAKPGEEENFLTMGSYFPNSEPFSFIYDWEVDGNPYITNIAKINNIPEKIELYPVLFYQFNGENSSSIDFNFQQTFSEKFNLEVDITNIDYRLYIEDTAFIDITEDTDYTLTVNLSQSNNTLNLNGQLTYPASLGDFTYRIEIKVKLVLETGMTIATEREKPIQIISENNGYIQIILKDNEQIQISHYQLINVIGRDNCKWGFGNMEQDTYMQVQGTSYNDKFSALKLLQAKTYDSDLLQLGNAISISNKGLRLLNNFASIQLEDLNSPYGRSMQIGKGPFNRNTFYSTTQFPLEIGITEQILDSWNSDQLVTGLLISPSQGNNFSTFTFYPMIEIMYQTNRLYIRTYSKEYINLIYDFDIKYTLWDKQTTALKTNQILNISSQGYRSIEIDSTSVGFITLDMNDSSSYGSSKIKLNFNTLGYNKWEQTFILDDEEITIQQENKAGTINVTGTLQPRESGVYSLGSPDKGFLDVYLIVDGAPKKLTDILREGGLIT